MSHRKSRPRKDAIELLFAHGLWLPTRTLYLEQDADDGITHATYLKTVKCLAVLAADPAPLTIILNSPGGSAIDGMAIYDAISELDNHVTIKVYGEAASMGSVILQAGDHRIMSTHAVMMLHDGHESVRELHCRDFERRAEESKRSREEMYGIFAARSGRPKEYFRRKLAHDWMLTADAALKEGLIDEIVDSGRGD